MPEPRKWKTEHKKVMTTDLCRIVVYCESDWYKYHPFYPKPKSGAEYAFKLDLIVLLIPEYRVNADGRKIQVVENDKVKIEKDGKPQRLTFVT